jgi:tellurite resistance protein TehA-like permease
MGTGIVSILLHNLPYNGQWLYWLSVIMFVLNVVLFVVFTLMTMLRFALWPELFGCMLRDMKASLFLGTFPMALSTIVNMVVFVCVPAWGSHAVTLAWTLWWINVVLAVAIAFWMPFVV